MGILTRLEAFLKVQTGAAHETIEEMIAHAEAELEERIAATAEKIRGEFQTAIAELKASLTPVSNVVTSVTPVALADPVQAAPTQADAPAADPAPPAGETAPQPEAA